MTYTAIRNIIEAKVVALGGVYYSGELQDLGRLVEKLNSDDVVFLNEVSDQNTDVLVNLSGGMKNRLNFRFYILQNHKGDLSEYQLDAYYSMAITNGNKLVASLINHDGNNLEIESAQIRRLKMKSPNLFAGGLLTFSLRIRGEC